MVIGTGARQQDVLLGQRCDRRVLAEQPSRKPLRVLEPDAAVAEVALVLGEQLLLRRVVQIDAVAVGRSNLKWPRELAGPGFCRTRICTLPAATPFQSTLSARNDLGVVGEGGDDLIAALFEIGVAVLEHARGDDRLREIGSDSANRDSASHN